MSLDETNKKLEWRKCAFEWKLENKYGIENQNDIYRTHDN